MALDSAWALRRFCRRQLYSRAEPLSPDELRLAAIVFSPHFDDETLGCGGTIALKKRAGAELQIVFMTDGSKSHPHSPSELRRVRRLEAIAAAAVLGVPAGDVERLDFEETSLNEHAATARDAVADILRRSNAQAVFVPYSHEPPLWSLDHRVTTRVVLAALRACRKDVVIYEYPIWFWLHWPWVRLRVGRDAEARSALVNTLRHGFGARALRDLRYRVCLDEVSSIKRAALSEYRSQTTRLLPDGDWPILADVAGGDFLECFSVGYEMFRRYRMRDSGDSGNPEMIGAVAL